MRERERESANVLEKEGKSVHWKLIFYLNDFFYIASDLSTWEEEKRCKSLFSFMNSFSRKNFGASNRTRSIMCRTFRWCNFKLYWTARHVPGITHGSCITLTLSFYLNFGYSNWTFLERQQNTLTFPKLAGTKMCGFTWVQMSFRIPKLFDSNWKSITSTYFKTSP